ncbi:MAG: carboxypeptidase-like regulatory domain-containing protein, partial [Planctomycetota bacterium]
AATSGQRCCVVVAPAIALSGLCLDEAGAPLAGALVTLAPPRDLRARLAVVLDFSEELPFTTQSDAAGRFRFERAPALPDGVLAARLAEYRVHEEPAPPFARHDLVLVLERERDTTRRLTGQVVGPRGEPLEDALVALGLDTTRTNGEGRFSFDLADEKSFNRRARAWMHVREDRLRALKPGYLPSELVAITRAGEEQPQWPSPLVLRLAGTPLALTGRVLDERGEALAGMRVWLADPSFFGGVRRNEHEDFPAFVQSESLLAGAEPGWNFALSGADGSFRLEGLLERDYTVAAMDPHSLLRCEEAGVAAGSTDVRLVLDRSQLFARLAGVVVDGRGEPVAGLEVFAMCDALVSRLDGEIVGTQHEVAAGVVTDAEGRFELVNVPRTLAYLRLQGAETIPLEWGRGLAGGLAQLAGEEPERVRITVERRCHFRVELADPGLADELATDPPILLVDRAGRTQRAARRAPDQRRGPPGPHHGLRHRDARPELPPHRDAPGPDGRLGRQVPDHHRPGQPARELARRRPRGVHLPGTKGPAPDGPGHRNR